MGKAIVKLKEDFYVEWSSICDAPLDYGMTRESAIAMFGYGRVIRADNNIVSYLDRSFEKVEDFIKGNRAGESETELNLKELIDHCTRKKTCNKW